MPFGDGTGPMGYGPMTGRGAGYCAGYSVPGYMNPWGGYRGFGWGRGLGWGRGRGRGRGWGYAAGQPGWGGVRPVVPPAGAPVSGPGYGPVTGNNPFFPGGAGPDPSQEAEYLKEQASFLEQELTEVQKRLAQLEAESKEEE